MNCDRLRRGRGWLRLLLQALFAGSSVSNKAGVLNGNERLRPRLKFAVTKGVPV